jgi:two-component system cell cycle response regulator
VLLDIVLFKRISDEYGHSTGDAARRARAATVRTGLRRRDIKVRWGGEELALLMPGMTAESAAAGFDCRTGRPPDDQQDQPGTSAQA